MTCHLLVRRLSSSASHPHSRAGRLGLARPDMALQRLIKKDALRPRKINGRLAFDKEELDRIVEKGDQFRRRGRPPKNSR